MATLMDVSQRVGRWLGTDDISLALRAAVEAPRDRPKAEALAGAILSVVSRTWSEADRSVALQVLDRVGSWGDQVRAASARGDASLEEDVQGDTQRLALLAQVRQARADLDPFVPPSMDAHTTEAVVGRVRAAWDSDTRVTPDRSSSEAESYWARLARAWKAAGSGGTPDWQAVNALWDSIERHGVSEPGLRGPLQALVPGWAGPARTEVVARGFVTGLAGVGLGLAAFDPWSLYAVAVSVLWLGVAGRFALLLVKTHPRAALGVAVAWAGAPLTLLAWAWLQR